MIKVGTSGWSYPEWRGPFYPERLPAPAMLDFYAHHFPAVELNASYYRIPAPRATAAMAERAAGRLLFAVKTHQDMTHNRAGYAAALPAFREALGPLREAGSLGCVLAQFPSSFQASPPNLDHLKRMAGDLAADPVVVEFRHRSWITEETFRLLEERRLGFCCTDEPRLPSLPPPVVRATAAPAYVRFHGRNRAKWWQHQAAWERYDYLYSQAELAEWVPQIRSLAERAGSCFVFFNNHARGQAVSNAQALLHLLGA